MNIIKRFLIANRIYIAGAISGILGGYLYWYYIGCASGTCPITSSPTMSMLWGGTMGALLFGIFKKETKNEKE